VKVIKLSNKEDLKLRMVIKEINILKKIKHPNIIQFHGAFIEEDNLYLVVEYCEAGALNEIYTDMKEPFNEEQIVFMCHEVLLALKYLHEEKGIIHRDIKGANILLTRDGRIKLSDFGSCGEFSHKGGKNMRISFIGTPYWMAPEVIQNAIGLKPYDEKIDVWSLGITAIECSQCDPPLANLDPLTAMYIIPVCPPPTLKEVLEWSEQFKNFISLCLIKEPKDRPSVQELLDHEIFKNINPHAFEDICSCVDTWDDWSWAEDSHDNNNSQKEIKNSPEVEKKIINKVKEPRRSNSFQLQKLKKEPKEKRKSLKKIKNRY